MEIENGKGEVTVERMGAELSKTENEALIADDAVRPVLLAKWQTDERPRGSSKSVWAYLALVAIVCVGAPLVPGACAIPFLCLALWAALQIGGELFDPRVKQLGDVPSLSMAFECTATIFYQDLETGQDQGLVTFLDGVMYFNGLHTAFSLRSQDVTLRPQGLRRGRVMWARLPTGEQFSLLLTPRHGMIGSRAYERFILELKRFDLETSYGVAYSTYPPAERRLPYVLNLDGKAWVISLTATVFVAWAIGWNFVVFTPAFIYNLLIGVGSLAGILAWAFYANNTRIEQATFVAERIRSGMANDQVLPADLRSYPRESE